MIAPMAADTGTRMARELLAYSQHLEFPASYDLTLALVLVGLLVVVIALVVLALRVARGLRRMSDRLDALEAQAHAGPAAVPDRLA